MRARSDPVKVIQSPSSQTICSPQRSQVLIGDGSHGIHELDSARAA
jgi:hypothetical protein